MTIVDLYSKRRKRARGDVPDVLQYDEIPVPLRVQICRLLEDIFGSIADARTVERTAILYAGLVRVLRREYGVDYLKGSSGREHPSSELHGFVRTANLADEVLDVVELAFRGALASSRANHYHPTSSQDWAPAVEAARLELNARFLEHGVGYQLEAGEIIRTDSKLVHAEVVRPALQVLSDPAFRGAEEEFLQAFEHHRHGQEKDALVWSLKALESTLKIICTARGWPDTGQAKDLLDRVFVNGLIESIWQSEFAGLRSVLESGVPTARNKLSGHGQGVQSIVVPGYLAAFVLHQTAAAIVFLVEAHKAKP